MRKIALSFLLVAVLAAPAAANPVTVQNTGASPSVSLNLTLPTLGNVNAQVGVENLLVDGVAYQGFCIDLYHLSSSASLLYNVDPLASSPTATPPGAMGADKADFIKEMWAFGYANAVLSNNAAAGFQLALWGILQGSIAGGVVTPDWTWLTGGASTAGIYGADALILWTNSNSGPLAANVFGLNHIVVGTTAVAGQSYAIAIPDGGATLMLLGGALMGLGALRRRFRQ